MAAALSPPLHEKSPPNNSFVRIPGGRFLMGGRGDDKFVSAVEMPQREIAVEDFFLASAPVTEADWALYHGECATSPSVFSRLPVVNVSWHEACGYTSWLSRRLGMVCRLPTESEWEYACRGGTESIFPFGGDISPKAANYLYNESGLRVGPGKRTSVASYPANAFGIFDMIGNVCEWTADSWEPLPGEAASVASANTDKRTIRGGAWDHLPRLLRCSWRDWAPMNSRYDNLGFRVAADVSSR